MKESIIFQNLNLHGLIYEYLSLSDNKDNNFEEELEFQCIDKFEKNKNYIYFYENQKNPQKAIISMFDLKNKIVLPSRTNIKCWKCRSSFTTSPLGCPLKYLKKCQEHFFETEGIFCSFPCMKRYLKGKKNNVFYRNSTNLMLLQYYLIHGEIREIPTAGSWKMLIEYGGSLSIHEFRNFFGIFEYRETNSYQRVHMATVCQYIEEISSI